MHVEINALVDLSALSDKPVSLTAIAEMIIEQQSDSQSIQAIVESVDLATSLSQRDAEVRGDGFLSMSSPDTINRRA